MDKPVEDPSGSAPVSTVLASLCEGKTLSETRMKNLTRAVELGACEAALVVLRDAERVSQKSTIILPKNHLQSLSRGRGWCRSLGKNETEWGDRTEDGDYEVGPGRWSVGATDGFSRKRSLDWTVKHVQVGPETWTVAN